MSAWSRKAVARARQAGGETGPDGKGQGESEDASATPAELERAAYALAIKLLSRRDHSVHELTTKLGDREHDKAAIDAVLDRLQREGYQNDERYAALYAEQRQRRGFGPRSIQAKLSQRGIDGTLARQAIEALEVDWAEAAADALKARFGVSPANLDDRKVQGRMARFLASRGFDSADVFRALKSLGAVAH